MSRTAAGAMDKYTVLQGVWWPGLSMKGSMWLGGKAEITIRRFHRVAGSFASGIEVSVTVQSAEVDHEELRVMMCADLQGLY